ncbi:MAG: porphobilinogen synthase [Nitriliruptoraceae bacterium]
MSRFPATRMRRLRRTAALRRSFRETRVHPGSLVLPVFVKEGLTAPEPIASMPGVHQHPPTGLGPLARQIGDAGIGGVMLFGIPEHKDDIGSGGWDAQGPVPVALRALRAELGDDVVLWADVCQCEYTSHGHCGPVDAHGDVDNDRAVEGYVRDAIAYAEAGAGVIAPSGMMDGQVAAIRAGLDGAGADQVAIVAYAAKYASAFYGPFRDAAESVMAEGDRASHQMDPGNGREALRELELDLDEGADALMVKPALPYLDILARARDRFDVPLVAYQVSGEYAMIAAAAERGWIDGDRAIREAVLSILRAGADVVLTYAALDLAADPI